MLVLVTAICLALASTAVAQTGSGIAGVVRDAQGAIVPGVTVTITGPAGTRAFVTDGHGAYSAVPLAPGTYQVKFELAGFHVFVKDSVVVAAKAVTTVDATIEIQLVESVTVTAQKREEDLQTVPLAVTALTSQAIERGRVVDIQDLSYNAPGVAVSRAGEDIRPAIRGARTENVGATNDPAVGFFVDGLYKTRPSMAVNVFVDVDRVEVMRGPQGTLFGRNTFGGLFHVVNKLPSAAFEVGGDVTFGDYHDMKANGFVNIPFGDKVQFRLAYNVESRDGYIKNDYKFATDLWDENMRYVRGTLRVAPNEKFELLLRTTYWKQGGNGQGDFGFANLGTVRDPNYVLADGAHAIALDGIRDPVSPRRGTAGSVVDVGPYEISRDAPFTRNVWEQSSSVELNYHAQWFNVKSLTSYGKFHSFRANDGDYSSNVHAYEETDESEHSWSEEATVSSANTKRLTWVAGVYYLNDHFDYRFYFNRAYLDTPNPALPDLPTYTTTTPNPSGLSSGLETLKVTSKAVYGQATFEIVKNVHATAGARYTDDSKTYSYYDEVAGRYGTSASGLLEKDVLRSWSKTTYRVGADYQFRPSNMLYGAVSTGYIAGGFAFSAPTAVYNPQNVTAYEVGSKNQIGDRAQVNVSVYHNVFRDLLANQFTTDPVTGAVYTYQINAGAVNSTGVEVEAQAAPVDNLRVGATLTVQDAKYGKFLMANPFPVYFPNGTLRGTNGYEVYGITPGGSEILNLEGHQVANSPTFRLGLNLSYDFRTDYGVITPIIQTFISSSYTAWDLKIGRDGVNVQPSYTRTDLRLEYVPKHQPWRVQAYVQNVEGHAILVRGLRGGDNFIQGVYDKPRTAGVRLTYLFR